MLGDALSLTVFVTQLLLAIVGVVFFISGLDDLVVDIVYVAWQAWKRLYRTNANHSLSEEELCSAEEQAIAIMIPAWDESAVIRPVLSNMLRTIEYANYHVFVGTYPNDPATQAEVDIVMSQFSNVHRTVCPNKGPTCKADCLNSVYQAIRLFEERRGIAFSILMMEDCEDLVHPLALKLMNHLIPSHDFVQLPVFPLEREWHKFTCGHYIDEFCEYHGKDVLVRGLLSGVIPAAGVGCGFSRKAVDAMAGRHDDEVFNTNSLTEDYEFGLRLGGLSLKSLFVNQPMQVKSIRPEKWIPRGGPDRRVGIREYFPSNWKAAVKQKSRWVLGIAIQGWKNLGWKGTVAMKYTLLRDRKGIITNEVTLVGYLIVIFVLILSVYTWVAPHAYRYPPLVEKGSVLWDVLLVNAGFLMNRLIWRSYSVYRIYGIKQACLAIPRLAWGNIINGCATSRALYLYARSLALGRRIAWDKTAHVLPTHVVLVRYPGEAGEGARFDLNVEQNNKIGII